jgi:hypothetical protein
VSQQAKILLFCEQKSSKKNFVNGVGAGETARALACDCLSSITLMPMSIG